MAFLDTILPILIIVFLGLAVWALVSKDSVVGVIKDIWEFIMEKKESSQEVVIGIYDR